MASMTIADRLEALLRRIYYGLTPGMRRKARRLVFLPSDLLRSRKQGLQPPRGKVFIGSGDFIQRGKEQVQLLRMHAGLRPDHRVLDVGSGIGRTAVALMDVLRPPGGYEGFDVVKEGVEWCDQHITATHPWFRFTHVDLVNDLYNLRGEEAATFRFPYGDDVFDVIYLFSVFTHMTKPDVGRYLQEIARVMKPGGRCLATFFLYTPATEAALERNDKAFRFPVTGEGFRLMDAQVKGANIAFALDTLDAMVQHSGLRRTALYEGYWRDQRFKREGHEFQDVVILEKAG
jgi:ubiquinone/menaquinone biosynthesis C-methylase UbiE